MPRVLCIHLPLFRIERLSRSRPALRKRAFVVYEAQKTTRTAKILEVSDKARLQGVRSGMLVSEGQASIPDLLAFPDKIKENTDAFGQLVKWSRCFGPQSYRYRDCSITVKLDRESQIFGGEAALLNLVLKTVRNLGYTANAAIATTPAAAWALAAHGRHQPRIAHSDDYLEKLGELPIDALGLPLCQTEDLALLGLQTIQHLQNIGITDLATRWPFAYERLRALSDPSFDELERPIQVHEQIVETWQFEDLIQHFKYLEQALAIVIQRICQRLKTYHGPRGIRSLQISLFCPIDKRDLATVIPGSALPPSLVDTYHLSFRKSYHLPKQLLSRILESIENRKPAGPFQEIRVEVRQFEEPEFLQQQLFIDLNQKGPLNCLLDRLNQRLGFQRVSQLKLVDDHCPEIRSQHDPFPELKQVTPQPGNLNFAPANRPLRLYREPKPILCELQQKRPKFVLRSRQRYKIITLLGPEKIRTRFWDNLIERDYFSVEILSGLWLWIYYDEALKTWFEHGCFD